MSGCLITSLAAARREPSNENAKSDSPMDIKPHGKARRKSSSSLDPILNILSETKAEVSNTSAFRREEDSGGAGGRGKREFRPARLEEVWEVRLCVLKLQ